MGLEKLASRMFVKLYEDDHYLFIRKPAGLSLHSPRQNCPWGVVQALETLKKRGSDRPPLRTCYPLEKHASGVLGLAKSADAARRFDELIRRGGVQKEFVACVKGKYKVHRENPASKVSSVLHGVIPSNERPGLIRVGLIRQHPRRAMVRCTCCGSGSGKIRRRLHDMGLRVVGDAQYDPRCKGRQLGRFFLHLKQVDFTHPFTAAAMRVQSPVPDSFDVVVREQIPSTECLSVALARRMPFLLDETSDSFRLLDGKGDGFPGLVAEKFGEVLILQVIKGKFQLDQNALRQVAAWYGDRLGVRAVYVKTIPRDRSDTAAMSRYPMTEQRPIWGQPVEPEVPIREDGMKLLIRPYDGYLPGWFLEHRENRRKIRALSRMRRVLNTFAYTCGFSLVAAVGGATSTVNVDISKKALEWGKRNFRANGISLEHHRFFGDDVFHYFKRARRQGQRFDLIILDPPTFSRTKKPARVFRVEEDLQSLIHGALELLEPKGIMLVSVNHKLLSGGWLCKQIHAGAGERRYALLDPPLGSLDFNAEHPSKTVLVQFDN